MAGSQDNEPPVIGSTYNGSRVVDVQVEVTDRGMRTRKRSTITLENGIFMKLDHWVEKKFEQLDTSRRRAPPRTRSSAKEALPQRGLPKSKSGRHLPKPTAPGSSKLASMRSESPARGIGRSRSSSRGRDVIVKEVPGQSKSSDLSRMSASINRTDRIPRPPQRHEDMSLSPGEANKQSVNTRDLSPEPTTPKRPSSLKNLSGFLTSPKRRAPGHTRSGNDLDAMRNSLHSCNSKSSMTECSEESSRKRGSLKKLGNLIPKPTIGRAKSDDELLFMQEETKREVSRPRRRSTATSESNKEKLRSFKEMISPAGKATRNKTTVENGRRRSSLQDQLPPVTPKATSRSVTPQVIESPQSKASPQREPSLSPEDVQKPSSSSYITGILDKLYDSYIKDDEEDGSDGDSDGGYGQNSSNFLDASLTKFVEWAE